MSRHPLPPPRMSRRSFLRLTASTAGVLAAPPLLRDGDGLATILDAPHLASAPASAALRVGVVLPRSTLYPTLGRNFLDGMQLYLTQAGARSPGRAITLLPAEYGVGLIEARKQTRTLIEQGQVGLVVGVLSAESAFDLRDLLHERDIPLIRAGVGAEIVRESLRSPAIFHSSLGGWQAAMALGAWAARSLGRRAAMASSFYESGYDTGYAFRMGYESAGGTIALAEVTHVPGQAGGLAQLLGRIQEIQPDLVYASYSGQQAVEFVRAYDEAGLARRSPLLGSSFLVDESLLPEQGRAAQGIRTALSWAPDLGTAENRAFSASYRAAAGRPADAFAVLGYDTARLIGEALGAGGPAQLAQALGAVAFSGPRGAVAVDAEMIDTSSPLYLREVRGGAKARNVVVAQLDRGALRDGRVAELRETLRTGWLNGYLCI